MKFHFDPDLPFQIKAIQATLRLFEGTQRQQMGFALQVVHSDLDYTPLTPVWIPLIAT